MLTPVPDLTDPRVDTPLPPSPVGRSFPPAPARGLPLRREDTAWVAAELASMTDEELVGQMIVSRNHHIGEELVDKYRVGGFVFLGNGQAASNIIDSVNRLQRHTRRPLWFAIDSEAGVGARVADATVFPMMMAFGAANDPELMEECGRITARESQALGLQVAYGPVVDINTEPRNPIICTRSMSAFPDRVTPLAAAFLSGARAEGVLNTLKHYPGQGDAAVDTHAALPSVSLDREELWRTHLAPYRDLVPTGAVDMMMTAHVAYPKIDTKMPTTPATLSPYFCRQTLRGELHFDGVLLSDAYDMGGIGGGHDEQELAVRGVEAGLDIILGPRDEAEAFTGILKALQSGRISRTRLEESVRRILVAKSRAGLPERRFVDTESWRAVLSHPEHRAVVRRVCEKAFTELRSTLPSGPAVRRDERVLVIALASTTRIFYRFPSSLFTDPFQAEVPAASVVATSVELPDGERNAIVAEARSAEKIVVLGYDWSRIASAGQVALIEALTGTGRPVIYVSFGAPYHLSQIPNIDAFYCGYSSVMEMQQVAVEVLLGDRKAIGSLPVPMPGN